MNDERFFSTHHFLLFLMVIVFVFLGFKSMSSEKSFHPGARVAPAHQYKVLEAVELDAISTEDASPVSEDSVEEDEGVDESWD